LIPLRIILERIGQVFTGFGRNDSFLVFSQVFAAPGKQVGARLGAGAGWCAGAAPWDTIRGTVPDGGWVRYRKSYHLVKLFILDFYFLEPTSRNLNFFQEAAEVSSISFVFVLTHIP
jgi:hypothetical protein